MDLNLIALSATIVVFAAFYNSIATDIRHPTNLYLISWIIVFAFLEIPLVSYIDISTNTYFYILMSILVFSSSAALWSTISKRSRENSLKREGFFISTPLLLGLGWASLITALLYYQTRFGIDRLLTDPGYVRTRDTGGTGLLGLLIFLPTVVFILLLIQARLRSYIHWTAIIYCLAVIAYVIILPERTTAINTLVWTILSLWSVDKRTVRIDSSFFRKYTIIIIAVPIFVIGFFITVSQRTQKVLYLNSIDYALNVNSGLPMQFFDPYIYLTGSVPALETVLDKSDTNGAFFTFNPEKTAIFPRRIYQLLTGGESDDKLTSNAEFARIPFKFNTYTWLYEPINDYGKFGSLIYVCLCGVMVGLTWAYRRWVVGPFSCYIYGWAGTASIFTVLTNKFSSVFFTYAIVIVIILLILTNGLNQINRGALSSRKTNAKRA